MTMTESPRNGVNDTPTNGSSKEGEIDREKVCPLLLRVFCANSRHNNLTDYNRGKISEIHAFDAPQDRLGIPQARCGAARQIDL